VCISIDPIYKTDDTFYLNTQVGESLITNPDPNSVPEEILLYQNQMQGGGYLVLRLSNLVNPGELVMDQVYLNQMRDYLTIIHNEFSMLYDVVDAEGFGMDIEYKVTAQDQLAIKQARPWVSFWADINGDYDLGVTAIVDPQSSSSLGSSELVSVTITNFGLNDISDFDIELIINNQTVETLSISQTIPTFSEADFQFTIPHDFSSIGDYNITVNVSHVNDEFENNNSLSVVVSKILEMDGAISIGDLAVVCDNAVEVETNISNLGETTITQVLVEVVVNGVAVDTVYQSIDIPFQEQDSFIITITNNLQQSTNEITLNLLEVNTQSDGDLSNNSTFTNTNLDSDFDIVTLLINADNYPQETSWKLYDEGANRIVATGALQNDAEFYSETICLDYTSCFTLYVYDSYGDGICCGYGEGNFSVLDSNGNVILTNTGEFDYEAQEVFCPDGTGCSISAEIDKVHATSYFANDGVIKIHTSSGLSPFEYSIDGGITFLDTNLFQNLAPGDYEIVVLDSQGLCTFEALVTIEGCEFTTVDILATEVSSVVAADGSISITPTSGVGPYLYSIDGGQNFNTNTVFSNLAVGTYNVVVKDELGICSYKESIPIKVRSQVVINEINYNSNDAFKPNDWIELYNSKSTAIDISNWQIKDNNDSHIFTIPENTQIVGNGYLVIVKNELDFVSAFPNLPIIGELSFGLGQTDAVRLYNSNEKLVDEVHYSFQTPWPNCANGSGNTLELISPDLDNSMPENWDCINAHGSPMAINGNSFGNGILDDITIYPNPFHDILYVLGDLDGYKIEIYSLIGQIVNTSSNTNEIDLSLLSQGVYLIKISNENSSVTKRIIKF
jgi:hypothetical protein